MQPRTGEFSAMSEALMTCWYHSGKLSSRVGVTAVFLALDMGGNPSEKFGTSPDIQFPCLFPAASTGEAFFRHERQLTIKQQYCEKMHNCFTHLAGTRVLPVLHAIPEVPRCPLSPSLPPSP